MKLVYWGTGNIGKLTLEFYSDIRPYCFIDSRMDVLEFCGFKVLHPNEISNWDEYFIVVTHKGYKETFRVLSDYGLTYGINYTDYIQYFHIGDMLDTKILEETRNRVAVESLQGRTLIASDFMSQRVRGLIYFFSNMAMDGRAIVLTDIYCVKKSMYEESIGMPVIPLPDSFSDYDATCVSDCEIAEIEKIRNRKERKEELSQLLKKYIFVRNLFKIILPKSCIIWGGWEVSSYIIEYVCRNNSIPFYYMEFGWIPGTFQLDAMGIAGQGVCNKNYDEIARVEVNDNELIELKNVMRYVIENRIDSYKQNDMDDTDKAQIEKLDKDRKTIFMVGMDDYGMNMNPKCDYWEENISRLFKSTKEAVWEMLRLCSENGWNIIFKPHPSVGGKNISYENELPDNVILIKNAAVHDLIKISDVVVSIASTVECTALIYGKPLVQLGITALNHSGATYTVESKNQIGQIMNDAVNEKDLSEKMKNRDIFFARLLKTYLWDDKTHVDFAYGRDIFEK